MRAASTQREDPMAAQHRVRQASEHQRVVLDGLSDERLALVADRLAVDKQTEPAVRDARLAVVNAEIERRVLVARARQQGTA